MSQKRIETTINVTATQVRPLGRLAPLAGLSFEKSLDPFNLDESISLKVCQSLNGHLDAIPGAVPMTANLLLAMQKGEMRVIFSPEVQKALANGTMRLAKRGTSFIAKAVGKNGKFVETGEVVSGAVSLASLSAAAAVLVVQAAHMISAADLSKRLSEVSGKLDLVLLYREADQHGRLERIYYEVQRLTDDETAPRDPQQCLTEMQKLRAELVELRSVWRQEATIELEKIHREPGWILVDMVTSRKAAERSKNQGFAYTAGKRLRLIDYAFRLDRLMIDAMPELENSGIRLDLHVSDLRNVLTLLANKTSAEYLGEDAAKWIEFRDTIDARLCQFEPYIDGIAMSPAQIQRTELLSLPRDGQESDSACGPEARPAWR